LLLTVGPALVVVAACAGPLLGVFGPEYAAAADVLRVLLLGAAFRLVVVHELGALEAAGRAWSSARLHLYTTVPTLVVVGITVAAVAATGLTGMPSAVAGTVLLPVAMGYALVQVACCVAVLVPFPMWSRTRPEEQP
jgi:O-antigen/teichoic acid export membrane protein